MENKSFLPIILGSDENAYGNARLFCEAFSVRPLLICRTPLRPTAYSKILDIKVIENFDTKEVFHSSLLPIIKEKKKEYDSVVLVSCSDYYTDLISEKAEEYHKYIDNRFISEDILVKLNTKDRFYSLCEKYGMDYPKTVVAEPEEREDALKKSDISFPIVVKPENSNATEYLHCSFEGKKKVFFFDSEEEYLKMVRSMNLSDYKGKLIIQEFIPGGDDAMRVVNAYCGKNGGTLAVSLGQPVLEEYYPLTLGNYAAIISRDDKALCKKLAAFLDELHYVGFANFDMKFDRRTGKYMLFEINCRPGRSSFYVRGAGCNLMKMMAEDSVFDIRPETPVITERKSLWTAVPKGVLKKYVKNKELLAEILSLYKSGEVSRTLFNEKDMSFKRRLTVLRRFLSYYKSYAKYYFDKEKQT